MALPSTSARADTPEAREYNRIKRWLEVSDLLAGLALLIILLATGWTRGLRDAAYAMAGESYGLAVFFYVVMLVLLSKLIGLPIDYYAFKLEHRFHLSNQKFKGWVIDQFKSLGVGLVIGVLVIEILYYTIREWPDYWWVVTWFIFIVLVVVFAQIAPVVLLPLFYKFVPLEDEDLKQRLVKLSEKAGTKVRGVFEWKLSEKSNKANAALTGLGTTRRIIVSDTLLQHYSHEEIEAVLAHELGHHVHRHIPKGIFMQVAITFFGFWAAQWVLNYAIEDLHWFDQLADFANLPLLVLVSTVLSFLLMPAMNAYSRYNERQADSYCWQAIPSVQPFISSMNKLAEQNLAEREPSRFVEWMFHSHPPISKRIAAAEAYRRS